MLHNGGIQTDTEALIKAAAKKVFLKKGLAGARLQEIADAGISRIFNGVYQLHLP